MQVKIRGYRVELSEVESVIIRCCSQVANAVVNLWKGTGSEGPEELLIGYIILKEGIYSFNASAAKEELKLHLPAYMIPSFFQVIQEIPVLPSGKTNRKLLPNPTLQSGKCICYLYCKYLYPHTYYCFQCEFTVDTKEDIEIDDCFSLTQRKVLQHWARLLLLDDCSYGLDSDFFELGGHSMVAAKLVSTLRSEPLYADVGMTDVYKYRTLQAFSERLDDIANNNVQHGQDSGSNRICIPQNHQTPSKAIPSAGTGGKMFVKCLPMLIGLYIIFWTTTLHYIVPFWAYLHIDLRPLISAYSESATTLAMSDQRQTALAQSSETVGPVYGTLLGLATFALFIIAEMLIWVCYPFIVIVIKWIVLGKVKPGVYPLWGSYYWRWWIVHRLIKILPLNLYKGSFLLVWFYRLMGASIGNNVHIGTPYVSCLDMIEVGDDTSIGIDVFMEGFTVKMGKQDGNGRRHGWLIIGTVKIGSGCYIGSKSHLAINTVIPDDTQIAEFSMVPENTRLKAGKSYAGSPVEQCDRKEIGCGYVDAAEDPYTKSFFKDIDTRRLPHWLSCALQVVASFGFILVLVVAAVPMVLPLFMLNQDLFSFLGSSTLDKDYSQSESSIFWILLIVILSAIGFIVTFCLEVAALKWILLGDLKQSRKVFHVDSWFYVRKWFIDSLMQMSLTLISSVYATLCLPLW